MLFLISIYLINLYFDYMVEYIKNTWSNFDYMVEYISVHACRILINFYLFDFFFFCIYFYMFLRWIIGSICIFIFSIYKFTDTCIQRKWKKLILLLSNVSSCLMVSNSCQYFAYIEWFRPATVSTDCYRKFLYLSVNVNY